eukprot:TRINITY_DN7377_c0_g1_i1.p1 TRINITY_DN7377_c0_g1~~TRINITY_DN7377_c0_g1_i1.p1  ORF type:complete len:178 (+),score=35.59 TRINITY_DN7377_c0_g1_i1:34-567(+)
MKTALLFVVVLALVASAFASCTDEARALIARHEGTRKCVYKDSRGIKTIGIGFNLEQGGAKSMVERCGADYSSVLAGRKCLTTTEINCLFDYTYNQHAAGAKKNISSFSSQCCNVQMVLVDLDFNLGTYGLSLFHHFIADINAKSYNAAGNELTSSRWCRQVGNRCRDDVSRIKNGC